MRLLTTGLVRTFAFWRVLWFFVGLGLTPALADAGTITVSAGGNLQAAINAARPGDTIQLQPGATFVGNFTLPVKTGPGEITIRTAPDPRLPLPGQRLNPAAHASLLAKIRSGNSLPAIQTAPRAQYWRLELLEFGPNVNGYSDIIRLGHSGTDQTTLDVVPHHIVIDRCYVHGDPLVGQKRGIALNSAWTTIINSHISDIKGSGMDTQAIAGWNGPGPYVIENNYLEGAGENVMFGGADPQIPGLVPSDITFRLNYLSKPRSWQQPIIPTPAPSAAAVPGGGSLPPGTYGYRVVARRNIGQGTTGGSLASTEVRATLTAGGAVKVSWPPVQGATQYRVYGRTPGAQNGYWTVSGTSFVDGGAAGVAGKVPAAASTWTVKNIFELKNARRVLAEGNVLERCWTNGQTGIAIKLSPRNQSGTAPWSGISDITLRYNIVRHAGGGLGLTGYDDTYPSQQSRNIRIEHNLLYDITQASGSDGRFIQIGSGPANVTIEHNTVLQTGSLVYVYGKNPDGSYDEVDAFRFANNLGLHNSGIVGELAGGLGIPSIRTYFGYDSTVVRNVIAGGVASKYPADNFFPTVSSFMAEFADQSYRLKDSSPYRNAGTDGKDLGADIVRLKELTDRALRGNSSTGPSQDASPSADPGGPYAALTLTPVQVYGGASTDPDGTIASYVWSWGDGSPNSSGVSASHQYARAGTYTIGLVVTDDDGATANATTTVTITNRAPTANAGGPYSTQPGVAFTANGSGSKDLDGTIASYRWNWGDGSANTVSASPTASHTYGSASDYTVVLTVTDNSGATATASAVVAVRAAGGADLGVSALAVPETAGAGVAMTVSDTTLNQSGTAAPSVTRFYLSLDPALDATDVGLGSRAVPSLAAGASHSGSVSLVVPSSTPTGLYWVLAKADGNGAIAETQEENNVRLSVVVKVGPDLTVSGVTAPATAAAGGSIVVSDTTRNHGAGGAAGSATKYYLSADVFLDAADIAIGTRTVPGLAAGASNTGSGTAVIPAGTAGTYFLIAATDGNNAVAESVETNNTAWSAPVRIGPDLVVSALTSPTPVAAGATVNVTVTTFNEGGAAAPASSTRLYLSTDLTLDATDVLLGSRSVTSLAVNQSNGGTVAVTIPAGKAPGSYFIIAIADGASAIPEGSETNNTRTAFVQISAP
jgi:PKD repeat protein